MPLVTALLVIGIACGIAAWFVVREAGRLASEPPPPVFDPEEAYEWVVEHVPDASAFLKASAALVRPGGLMLLSTLNRTLKAYLLAIIGGEYILRWLPVGTHQWERFVTPDELARHLAAAGLEAPVVKGLVYNPLGDSWSVGSDTDVNYLASAAKPG